MKFLIKNYSLFVYGVMPLLIVLFTISSIIFFVNKNNELEDKKLNISKEITSEIVNELLIVQSISDIDEHNIYNLSDLIYYSDLNYENDINNIHLFIKSTLNAKTSIYTKTLVNLIIFKYINDINTVNDNIDNLCIIVNITFMILIIFIICNIMLLFYENRIKTFYNDRISSNI